ncbi:sugar kinase [Treponema sp. OMZ 840]|uniref:PfkB family carbohydrate kinase n=1 Tax=Treponema sp. OMZ 840 TaxID=244313 RepID=UPI003D8CB3CE
MNKTVVSFGEIMMRLNPKGFERFVQADEMEISYGGGEANVAVSLANYGCNARYVTKLPANDLGQSALNSLRHFGVDTSFIVRGGQRLGLYFVEKGASQRASKVIYDRKDSAIALASASDFDWDRIFEGASWFHFTGITPALGGDMPDVCLAACKKAKEKGLSVSCDLNYRKKLWTRDEAQKVMSSLMPYIDLCIANEEDASDVFGIKAENTDIDGGKLDKKAYVSVAKQICERFGCKKTAITLRGSLSASVNEWGGMLYDGGEAFFSKNYMIQIVDRVGGGDSFGSALIYALLENYAGQEAIEFAVAASALKHTIEHDFNLVSVDEVKALAGGNASGRVQR